MEYFPISFFPILLNNIDIKEAHRLISNARQEMDIIISGFLPDYIRIAYNLYIISSYAMEYMQYSWGEIDGELKDIDFTTAEYFLILVDNQQTKRITYIRGFNTPDELKDIMASNWHFPDQFSENENRMTFRYRGYNFHDLRYKFMNLKAAYGSYVKYKKGIK